MRILDTFTPTQTQKQVLAMIAGAATPTVAGDAISVGSNMVNARDTLSRLGFITFIGGEAILTDQGTQLATAENIIDETGALTPAGQALAQPQAAQPQETPATEPAMPPMESFAVLKSLLR
jgi:hypothetical protein